MIVGAVEMEQAKKDLVALAAAVAVVVEMAAVAMGTVVEAKEAAAWEAVQMAVVERAGVVLEVVERAEASMAAEALVVAA